MHVSRPLQIAGSQSSSALQRNAGIPDDLSADIQKLNGQVDAIPSFEQFRSIASRLLLHPDSSRASNAEIFHTKVLHSISGQYIEHIKAGEPRKAKGSQLKGRETGPSGGGSKNSKHIQQKLFSLDAVAKYAGGQAQVCADFGDLSLHQLEKVRTLLKAGHTYQQVNTLFRRTFVEIKPGRKGYKSQKFAGRVLDAVTKTLSGPTSSSQRSPVDVPDIEKGRNCTIGYLDGSDASPPAKNSSLGGQVSRASSVGGEPQFGSPVQSDPSFEQHQLASSAHFDDRASEILAAQSPTTQDWHLSQQQSSILLSGVKQPQSGSPAAAGRFETPQNDVPYHQTSSSVPDRKRSRAGSLDAPEQLMDFAFSDTDDDEDFGCLIMGDQDCATREDGIMESIVVPSGIGSPKAKKPHACNQELLDIRYRDDGRNINIEVRRPRSTSREVKRRKVTSADQEFPGGLSERALNTLRPQEWLSSDILERLLPLFNQSPKTIWVIPPYVNLTRHPRYKNATKVTSSHRMIVVPVSVNEDHWMLGWVKLDETKVAEARLYDPYHVPTRAGQVQPVLWSLMQSLGADIGSAKLIMDDHSLQQKDTYNCGIFTVIRAICLMTSQQCPNAISDESSQYWRYFFRALCLVRYIKDQSPVLFEELRQREPPFLRPEEDLAAEPEISPFDSPHQVISRMLMVAKYRRQRQRGRANILRQLVATCHLMLGCIKEALRSYDIAKNALANDIEPLRKDLAQAIVGRLMAEGYDRADAQSAVRINLDSLPRRPNEVALAEIAEIVEKDMGTYEAERGALERMVREDATKEEQMGQMMKLDAMKELGTSH